MGNSPLGGGTLLTAANPQFRPNTRRSIVHFNARDVQPPSRVYVTEENVLNVLVVNLEFQFTLTIRVRLLEPDGQIMPFESQLPLIATPNVQTFQVPLAEGFLLTVALKQANANPIALPLAVQVNIGRVGDSAFNPYDVLLQGKLAGSEFLAWPQAGIHRPTDGRGEILVQSAANPAAGADWTFSITPGTVVRLVSATWRLTTDVNVANRQVELHIGTAPNAAVITGALNTQPASTSVVYCAMAGGVLGVDGANTQIMPLPDDCLLWNIGPIHSVSGGLQAGDQYSNIRLLVERWTADF